MRTDGVSLFVRIAASKMRTVRQPRMASIRLVTTRLERTKTMAAVS